MPFVRNWVVLFFINIVILMLCCPTVYSKEKGQTGSLARNSPKVKKSKASQPKGQLPVTVKPKDWIRLITPQEGAEVISKRPEIKLEFLKPIPIDTLMVMLDGIDITPLLTLSEKGFEYKPIMVVAAGRHNVSISVTDKQGKQLQKEISFSSSFEEAYTEGTASVNYQQLSIKPGTATSVPDSKVELNVGSNTQGRRKKWQLSFNTNLRFLDQNVPVFSPVKKGFDLANWTLTGAFSEDILSSRINMGDIEISETEYTVSNLSRKGGSFQLGYDRYHLNLFSVKSEQVFGLENGIGINGNTDDHILGFSGAIKLFNNTAEFRTIYAAGGEPGSSFGISTTSGAKKGSVTGFVFASDFFEGKMMTEIEVDSSRFDPDTSDEFSSRSDSAYKLKASGFYHEYNYEALYEYIGRDFESIASQGFQKDKQGINVMSGIVLGQDRLNLTLSRYHDNVEGDELFPRLVNSQAGLDYSFNKITRLPIGLGFQRSILESTREPIDAYPVDTNTDTITGRVSHTIDKINLGFQTSYSFMDDRTLSDYDTSTVLYTLTSAYSIPNLSLNQSLSFNKSRFYPTDLMTDTYTFNFDVRRKFFHERASFNMAGTYNIIQTEDDSTNTRNLNAKFMLSYNLKKVLKGFVKPVIALRGAYTKITNRVYPNLDRDDLTLFAVLTTSMPFSF